MRSFEYISLTLPFIPSYPTVLNLNLPRAYVIDPIDPTVRGPSRLPSQALGEYHVYSMYAVLSSDVFSFFLNYYSLVSSDTSHCSFGPPHNLCESDRCPFVAHDSSRTIPNPRSYFSKYAVRKQQEEVVCISFVKSKKKSQRGGGENMHSRRGRTEKYTPNLPCIGQNHHQRMTYTKRLISACTW